MSDSSKDHKPKREPTTCANCAQKIVPFGEYSWAHVLGNLMCSLSARPVAEPVSTEPHGCLTCHHPVGYQHDADDAYTVLNCKCKSYLAARPSEPSAQSEWFKKCIKEGADCDCVGNCKYRPSAPQTSAEPNKNRNKNFDSELAALARKRDEDIDTSDIPEVKDWSGAVVGKFYKETAHQPATARKSPDSHLGAVRD